MPVSSVSERGGQTVFCLEELAAAGSAGVEARGDIRVTGDNTEATIAVGVSHKRGGGWVEMPLPPEERGPDSLYVFHV